MSTAKHLGSSACNCSESRSCNEPQVMGRAQGGDKFPPCMRLKGVGFFRGHGNLPLKSTNKTYPHTNQHNNHQHQAPLSAVHNPKKHPQPTHNTPTHDQHHTHPTRTTRRRTPKTPTNHAPPHTGGERSPNQSPPTKPSHAHHSPRA